MSDLINRLVREEMPDREKTREDCHKLFASQNTQNSLRSAMRIKRFISVVAASIMLFTLTVTIFATFGGFGWFVERFDPPFADVVDPIMVYSEQQGIRMKVIGAQSFDNMAIIYLSLQDITGENRLTESLDFMNSFRIDIEETDSDFINRLQRTNKTLLYFDVLTNTAYLEMQITMGTQMADPLSLSVSLIAFEVEEFEYVPVDFAFADIAEAMTIHIIPNEHIGGGFGNVSEIAEMEEILLPGHLTEMPHNADNNWISNIGIVDGKLRIQTILRHDNFGASFGNIYLISPDGEIIRSALTAQVWPVDRMGDTFVPRSMRYYDARPLYRIEESIFYINIDDLHNYTIAFRGRTSIGAEGDWRVVAYTSDMAGQAALITSDTWINGTLYEFMTLTPLGLQVRGSWEQNRSANPEVIYAETADELVPLKNSGGAFCITTRQFSGSWLAETPLDVSAVTAIIIDDVRISIP